MDYIELMLWKAAALCVLAFFYGMYKRIIETRPPAEPAERTNLAAPVPSIASRADPV